MKLVTIYLCHIMTFLFVLPFSSVESQEFFDPFSVHILETYQGIEPMGIECRLYKKTTTNDWIQLESRLTDERGRANDFIKKIDYTPGTYKFWFDSAAIYRRTKVASFLPFVEIVFEVGNLNEFYHVPVIISPFHATTNKGVFTPPNANPNATTPTPLPNPIGSFVFDIANGRPAAGMRGELYRLENGSWRFIISKLTTSTGSFRNLFNDSCEFTPGVYKMSFDTKSYWNGLGTQTFYPTVDLILDIKDTSAVVFTPVLISPYGYSFYKGGGAANGVPCPTTPTTTGPNSNHNHRPNHKPSGIIGGILSLLGLA